jgi:hypothetical protein
VTFANTDPNLILLWVASASFWLAKLTTSQNIDFDIHVRQDSDYLINVSKFLLYTVNIRNPDCPDFEWSFLGHNLCPVFECLAAILF